MSARQITSVAILAALYVVIGRFLTQYLPNPMVPGAIIAINMVVIVVAGILFGPTTGALVGLIGTTLNALVSPSGSRAFEFAAIIPHTIMGFVAGLIARSSRPAAPLAIIVGHVLNVTAFIIAGLIPFTQMATTIFSVGLLVETVIDLLVIWVAVAALRPVVRRAPA